MKRQLRIAVGSILALAGIVFFILPGSIFLLLIGLVMLSFDFPKAREVLRWCQNSMSKSARRLDAFLLSRKFKN